MRTHDRSYPSIVEAALQSSVSHSGLRIVGTEFPVLDNTDRILWYDIVAMAGDRLTLIDLEDWRHPELTQAKADYCKSREIPLLQVPMNKPENMEASVQLWALKLSLR